MIKIIPLPPREELLDRINYDPETGFCTWKNHKNRTDLNGKRCGSKRDVRGYNMIEFNKIKYGLHRIIYKIMTGEDPEFIDHIDGDPSNNCWSNLRNVTVAENNKNRVLDCRNKSGFHGVTWREDHKRWSAAIRINGKSKHLGSFIKLDDAIAARKQAEIELGFHENHGRS